jgi:LPS sulfotransferase NodH
MAIQWRSDGYADVDDLVAEYRRELELWEKMRASLDLRIIDVGRDELLGDPAAAAARVAKALGLEAEQALADSARSTRGDHRFVPEGHGQRYRTLDADSGEGDKS